MWFAKIAVKSIGANFSEQRQSVQSQRVTV